MSAIGGDTIHAYSIIKAINPSKENPSIVEESTIWATVSLSSLFFEQKNTAHIE